MRLLFLVSDAFGGHGGISRFNRDLAAALSSSPDVRELVILPRRAPHPPGPLPPRTVQRAAPPGKLGFAGAALREAAGGFDVVICGHINLMPVAVLARRMAGKLARRGRPARLALVIHGVDAWTPVKVPGLSSVDMTIAVSRYTLDRFRDWSDIAAGRGTVLPNTVDLSVFTPGPRPAALEERYGVAGARVLMGLARLDAMDRDKGFYELLAVLPRLAEREPGLRYLLCGDGTDRPSLEAEVRRLGLTERVVFTGFVPEEEKADHYRLADAFALCGRQEGFGIVLLEAMGCGVPVVASRVDGSREAVLDGAIGELADPGDPDDLAGALQRALATPRPCVPDLLAPSFGRDAFVQRVWDVLSHLA